MHLQSNPPAEHLRHDAGCRRPACPACAGGTPAPRHCIFDLDGTLIDSRPVIEQTAQAALAEVCPQHAGVPVTTILGPPIREMFRLALYGRDCSPAAAGARETSASQLPTALNNRPAEPIQEHMLDRLVAAFRCRYDAEGLCRTTPVYPGTGAMLAELTRRGLRLFILTNKPASSSRQILSERGIAHYFEVLVTPDWAIAPFTSKAQGLASLLQHQRLPPPSTVLVGDTVDDAAAAEACGVAFVAALYGYGQLAPEALRKNWRTIQRPEDLLLLFPDSTERR